MSNNSLTASTIKTEYPAAWSNSACVTCRYFLATNKADAWEWNCEHPNSKEYVELSPAEPRTKCSGHYLNLEETVKRIYTMRDLLRLDCGVQIVVVPINRDTIRINGKPTRLQTALALLNNLYESHASYKQALDRLNYCRHRLNIKDIKQ